MKKLIVFDLDGTLALSKSAIDPEMAELLNRLLGLIKVAIISGGDWPQFQKQVLSKLTTQKSLNNLSILPACGTKYYQHHSRWEKLYEENFSEQESANIISLLNKAIASANLLPDQQWGALIDNRGSQITYSGLGQSAPLKEKSSWDPDFSKRKVVKGILDKSLSDYSITIGGATSIDITAKGLDKAYGILKLPENLGILDTEMIFMGDALFDGGNDQPVRKTKAVCIRVRDPEETKRVIEGLLALLG